MRQNYYCKNPNVDRTVYYNNVYMHDLSQYIVPFKLQNLIVSPHTVQ